MCYIFMIKEMYRRKIQLVAGVTYTVSLPKEWVKKNNLGNKGEVTLSESSDGSLLVSPHAHAKSNKIETFELDVDAYKEDLGQILFVLYYLGAQNINIFSKHDLSHEMRSKVKDTVQYMAGTEIIFEDARHMKIIVLLDKAKVDVNQIYFRAALLIKSSIDSILHHFSIQEVTRNEEEVDRLYHLMSKIILLAHTNTEVLASSKIENTFYLTSYLLIAKKLENMSDRIFTIAELLEKEPKSIKEVTKLLEITKNHIDSAMSFFMNRNNKSYSKTDKKVFLELKKDVDKIKNIKILMQIDDVIRYLEDIEEELTNISFYTKLIKQKIL